MSLERGVQFCSTCGPGHGDATCPKGEVIKVSPTLKEQVHFHTPRELDTHEDKLKFITALRKNHELPIGDAAFERRFAETWVQKDEEQEGIDQVRYYAVEDGGEFIATGRLDVGTDKDGNKFGHLAALTVAPSHRGKVLGGRKLHRKMTDVRIEQARKEGCEYLDTTVIVPFKTHTAALAAKINSGFILTEFIDHSEEGTAFEMGAFRMAKQLEGEQSLFSDEHTEIQAEDLQAVDAALKEGWLGTSYDGEKIRFQKKIS